MNADPSFNLRIQTEAAKALLGHLRDEGHGDDAELIADAVEGETGLHEAIAAALDAIDENDVHIIGLKAKEDDFAARRQAKEKRNEFLRGAIEQAMVAAEIEQVRLPTATLSLTKRAPGLVVTDEAEVPSVYFTIPEKPAPKMDKKALLSDLRTGTTIPGATLDNGSKSLSIRRR